MRREELGQTPNSTRAVAFVAGAEPGHTGHREGNVKVGRQAGDEDLPVLRDAGTDAAALRSSSLWFHLAPEPMWWLCVLPVLAALACFHVSRLRAVCLIVKDV